MGETGMRKNGQQGGRSVEEEWEGEGECVGEGKEGKERPREEEERTKET